MYSNIMSINNDIKEKITLFEINFIGIIFSINKSQKQDNLFIVTFRDDSCNKNEKLICNIFDDKCVNWRIGDIVICEKIKVTLF
jgi:hypothetical protein